jgi:predicted RNA-binding protein YlxR (DUF448 family)
VARRGHEPRRTCAGCRASAPKADLVRLVRSPDGGIVLDPSSRMPGRGGYVHPTSMCIETAFATRGLARALRTDVSEEAAGRLRERLIELQERM